MHEITHSLDLCAKLHARMGFDVNECLRLTQLLCAFVALLAIEVTVALSGHDFLCLVTATPLYLGW